VLNLPGFSVGWEVVYDKGVGIGSGADGPEL